MPSWKGHLIFAGCLMAVALLCFYETKASLIPTIILYSPLFFVGALLPDLDSPSSKIRNWFFMLVLVLAGTLILIGYYSNNWWYALYAMFGCWLLLTLYLTKHRGLLHSFHFLGIFSILLYLTLGMAGLTVASGYVTHLVADGVFKN